MNYQVKKYYDCIVKNTPGSFREIFDKEWNLFLDRLEFNYAKSEQLQIGNRLRPLLACWGYMHSKDIANEMDFEFIAKVAVSVEAMHKASVIIDDVIDGDTKRRGVNCIHIDYSENEAIFFAVCMISAAIRDLNETMNSQCKHSIAINSVSLLCNTILLMCRGAILEITTSNIERINTKRITDIIDLETSTLLTNSLLIGYMSSGDINDEMYKTMESIGMRCGYIFQVLNDFEPFCNPNYIKFHKGNLNFDYIKSRKTMVIPYLYTNVKGKDKKLLEELLIKENNFTSLKNLFEKYQLHDLILQEVTEIHECIKDEISTLEKFSNNTIWVECFNTFVDVLIKYCISVLNGTSKPWN